MIARLLLAVGFGVIITSPIWLCILAALAERSMAGMRHGPYRMHLDRNGLKRPCYPNRCGCAWREDEQERAA